MRMANRLKEKTCLETQGIYCVKKGGFQVTVLEDSIYCTDNFGKKIKSVPYLYAYTKNKFQVE